MTTKIIDNEYARKWLPNFIGKTLIPKYWDDIDEDNIWVECIEDPKLNGLIYYAFLESWRIDGNT